MALDLRAKLARLAPPTPIPAIATGEKQERITRMRAVIDRLQARDRSRMGSAARAPITPRALPGETITTGDGPLHRIAVLLEPAHRHGRVAIANALSACPRALAALALDPALASIDPRRMLLIDTETTGLSGGTGTLPFLIGMASFEDESLEIEQLLLRTPGEERPMLARLAERIAWASCIVTYNGKSFDWPLLRTRAVMNRVPLPAPAAHLDLLHCARRIFAKRLGQVRLVQIETEILGLRRERDVDGSEIPELYWRFVRDPRSAVIAPVLEHNANDLIALAALAATLAERWHDALPAHDPEDRLGVARVALRSGDLDRARRFADAVLTGGARAEIALEALLLAAAAESKRGRQEEVARLLRAALAHATRDRAASIHLALTKHLEHRIKDPVAALHHAEEAAAIEDAEASARRIARLTKKQLRREQQRAARKNKPQGPTRSKRAGSALNRM